MSQIGYVAIEYNQASHQPEIIQGEIWDTPEEAQEMIDVYQARTRLSGRQERYAIGTVHVEDVWDL